MRTIKIISLSVFFVCLVCVVSFADNAEDGPAARYKLYEVRIDNIQTPVLLDTKTGKMWIYRFDSSSGKTGFIGVGVEGLAYVKKDIEQIDSQIQQWGADGILEKDVKNFRNVLVNEFSYSLDVKRTMAINNEMKAKAKQQ